MFKIILSLAFTLISISSQAADLRSLRNIFVSNFDRFYVPARCGSNVGRLIEEANRLSIDLKNSYVLKIVGSGFLETSGFYTRGKINERAMLGYFHFVFVADGYVFDFDLDEPLVLKLEDYIRLQFSPQQLPYTVFGINYVPEKELQYWTVSRFEIDTYLSRPQVAWTKKMPEIVNLKAVMTRPRVR
jgi:hypothetical protein